MLVVVLLFVILRREVISGAIWSNVGMATINHYPLWDGVLPTVRVPSITSVSNALRYDPNNVALIRWLGLSEFRQGNEEEAVAVWRQAMLEPVEIAVQHGKYAQIVGQSDTALAWYEYAVGLDAAQAEAWHQVGLLRQEAGDLDGAKVALEQALSLGHAASADSLATLLRDDGDAQAAAEVWQLALSTFPEHPDRLRWWYGLTNILRAEGQLDSALKATTEATAEFPDAAQLYVELGLLLYETDPGAVDKALQTLEHATQLDSDLPSAYSAMARISATERRYAAAYEYYGEALRRSPGNRSWLLGRANMARALGDYSLASELYEEIISLYSDYPRTYYEVAEVYMLDDKPEKAISAIRHAIELAGESNPEYYFRAGVIYEWIGEKEQARSAYQRVLELNNNNAQAMDALERLDE